MQAMFNWDSSLTELDLSDFDTRNVTSMQSMFYQCSELQNLNLDNWVINGSSNTIGSMFGWASKLKTISMKNRTIPETFTDAIWWRTSSLSATGLDSIDVSNWNFSGTNNLNWLFWSLKAKEIKWLETWDTSWIQNMSEMFYGCSNITGLNIKNWDVTNVTDMHNMFHSCSNLMNLDLGWWNTSNVTNVWLLLFWCSKLEWNMSWRDFRNVNWLSHAFDWKYLNLTNAKFSWSLDSAFAMAATRPSFEQIIFDWVDTSNVTSMNSMFNGCRSLTWLDLSSFDTSNVKDMRGMFNSCTNLKKLNLSWWNFRNTSFSLQNLSLSLWSPLEELNLTNAIFSWSMTSAFNSHYALINKIKLDWVDTSNVTSMNSIFYGQSLLTWLDLSSFDTSNVTDMSQMFSNCNSLTWLDLSNFNTSNVTNMNGIFGYCNNLEEINLSWWDFRNTSPNMMYMTYWWNSSINKLNITNAKYWTNMNQAFAWLRNLEEIEWLDTVDTSDVVDMSQMFYGCSGLIELDLSNFDTSNVNNMIAMFYNTPNLKTIYASDKFVTTNLSYNPGDMFSWTVSVVWWNWTKFDDNYIDKTYAKIDKVWQTWYFTDKNAITVKFISSIDKSETTATFTKWQKLTPPSVGGYHVAWWYLDEAMTQEIDLNKWVDIYSVVYVKYERNGNSGWWGGWGGWSSTKSDTQKDEQKSEETTQTGASSWAVVKEPETSTGSNVQTWSQINSNTGSVASSWENVNPINQDNVVENTTPMDSSVDTSEWQTYTQEFKQAYEFARENGITTMSTIQKADMNWKLTRIQMAKMLSLYAINILWKEPDVSKWVINFNDVTIKMNMDYDNWVTLAYQLWIMWQNMPNNKFRPNDEVSRAEFVTALSRLLYSTLDGKYESTPKYYINHMERLVKEWIITKDDPKMKELRGYVMLMLMRSAK